MTHWVKEDQDEVHVVSHPHDAVLDGERVLQQKQQQ
jgi:hypothetical protein